ncbi:hypothetical protein BG004_004857 [Podila humilis]|nr:hypothetical protein BG004_004857 [Podila humilis]
MKISLKVLFSAAVAITLSVSSVNAAAIVKRASSGYNDFNCQPSAAHPRPLLLVHGTTLTAESWNTFYPYFVKAGYCTFALTFGKRQEIPLFAGIARIEENAAEVGAYADRILAATGATQVDIVGHSQGGILGRYWHTHLGGAGKIGRLIGIAPIHHGTTLNGITVLATALGILDNAGDVLDSIAPALMQMVVGSEFMKKLNAQGDTLPGVYQANIATRMDEIITPFTNCFQSGASENKILQDLCFLDLHEHIFILQSKVVLRWVLNHLDPSTAKTANCGSAIGL